MISRKTCEYGSIRRSSLSVTMWIVALAGALLGSACDAAKAEVPPATRPLADADEAAAEPATTRPRPQLAGPPVDLEPPAAGREQLRGVVRERLVTGSYAYLRIELDDGSTPWVVTMGDAAELDTRVQVESFGTQHDFHSNRLDRDFDELVFGMVRPLPR